MEQNFNPITEQKYENKTKPRNRLRKRLSREKLNKNSMSPKITPKENLRHDAEWGWHGRGPRHDETVPKIWNKRPRTTQVTRVCGRATWLFWSVVPVRVGWPCYVDPALWDFCTTLFHSFSRLLSSPFC